MEAAQPEDAQRVAGQIPQREPHVADLGVLSNVHQFVGEQGSVSCVVAVVLEEDPATDGHTVSTAGEHGHGHDPNASGEGGVEHVVGREFGAFQAAHVAYDTGTQQGRSRRMVSEHYGRVDDLTATVLGPFPPGAAITIDDLATVDEFHLGGAVATAALAADLALHEDSRVLDIGSGVGGPARRLAASTGCTVVGVDLTPSFVATANDLSRVTGLDDRTSFVVGDATALDLEGPFDAATLIHVGMNIPDKPAFFASVAELLEPGARFGVYDIMAIGDSAAVQYPQPFATDPSGAWLAGPDDYVAALESAGFSAGEPIDRTQMALQAAAAAGEQGPPPVSLATLMGPDFATMFGNVAAAVRGGILAPVQIIATR